VKYSGERFIPQQADPFDEIAVEHQQRYRSISELVRGKIVLDAGCGEGYGTNFLAESAARVVGIDISKEAVENARAAYPRKNLKFRRGSVDALPFKDGSFDVVISFEVIEHLDEELQAAFLKEAGRVLNTDGILVISTPNKAVYTDDANLHNRFHKKEFYVDEFESFLRQVFPRVALFGQSWFISTALLKPFSSHFENVRLSDRSDFSPKYVVAVCGATDFVDTVDLSSVVIDQHRKLESIWKRVLELQAEVAARNEWVVSVEQDLKVAQKRTVELQEEVDGKNAWALKLEHDLEDMRNRVLGLQNEVEEKNSWGLSFEENLNGALKRVVELQDEMKGKNSWISSLEKDLDAARKRTVEVQDEIKDKTAWALTLEHDLEDMGNRFASLQNEVQEKNSWAFSLEENLNDALSRIVELQDEMNDKTAWALKLEHELEDMRNRVAGLQNEVEEKNSWALSLEENLNGVLKRVVELQDEIKGKNSWISSLEKDLDAARKRTVELQDEVKGKNAWALTLENNLEDMRNRVAGLQNEVEEKNSWALSLEENLNGTLKRVVELQDEVKGKNAWALTLENDLEDMRNQVAGLQDGMEGKNSRIFSLEQDLLEKRNHLVELQDEVDDKTQWAMSLEHEIREREKVVLQYKKGSEDLRSRLLQSQERIAGLDQHIGQLDHRLAEMKTQNESMLSINRGKEAELALVRTELELIKQSDFWKVASRYWRLRDQILPTGSRRRRLLKRIFRFIKSGGRVWALDHGLPDQEILQRLTLTGQPDSVGPSAADKTGTAESLPVEFPPLEFAWVEQPRVSILIPVFNQWDYTYRCLKSIQRTMSGIPCEILLADDGSTDMTAQAEQLLLGVKVLRGGKNRGFLRNCNLAASQARGEYIYFLNNDTELQPDAIQSLVSLLDRDPGVGIVGSKLVFPDGRIQEAGGIIWADASGWNFGRCQDASLPAFNYVKDVDYISGASFMIRNSLWKEIGGFDDRYAPAYCEDSDLAFEVRKRGLRVVYQPQSVVVHFEGVSHGTDVGSNIKANQVRNTEIMKNKWASVLARHFPNGENVFHARDRSAERKTILIIDHYVPHFDKDAGSRTMWAFIQAFLKMGMNVKFLGDNFFPHQPYTGMLQQAGVEVLTGPWFADHWPEWLEENGRYLDYVFLNRPHIAPKYIRPLRAHTNARLFYYVIDLRYLRESLLAELQNDSSLRARAEKAKAEEQHLMNQMDVLFSCSVTEANILRELCPKVDVIYVPPYAVDVDFAHEFKAAEREGILFVGGFSHPPNEDGVKWFIREIWPAVKKRLPDVVFSIAGANPPEEIRALASDDVKVLGFVSDERLSQLYCTSRLVVIPLRYGAGVKGKTVEAMAHGVPLVCTESGVEGMPGVEESLDPTQHTVPMAKAIVSLYHDSARLREISQRERAYVAQHYTLEKIQATFARVMDQQQTLVDKEP